MKLTESHRVPRWVSWSRWGALAMSSLLTVATLGVAAPAARAESFANTATFTPSSHYAAPIRLADGTIDAARTLAVVQSRGSDTYSYLLYPRAGYTSALDWSTLPAFLSEARRLGLKVTLDLTPPSSTSSSAAPCSADLLLPYRGRYDTWMREIGTLARTNPNLVRVNMDDYAYSSTNRPGTICPSFAPGTLTRWNAILTANAGRPLKVAPVLYLADLVGGNAIYPSIKREAPVIVWPYTSDRTISPLGREYDSIKALYPGSTVESMLLCKTWRWRTYTDAGLAIEVGQARSRGSKIVYYQQALA